MAITASRAAIESAHRQAQIARDERAIAAASRLIALMDANGANHVTA